MKIRRMKKLKEIKQDIIVWQHDRKLAPLSSLERQKLMSDVKSEFYYKVKENVRILKHEIHSIPQECDNRSHVVSELNEELNFAYNACLDIYRCVRVKEVIPFSEEIFDITMNAYKDILRMYDVEFASKEYQQLKQNFIETICKN